MNPTDEILETLGNITKKIESLSSNINSQGSAIEQLQSSQADSGIGLNRLTDKIDRLSSNLSKQGNDIEKLNSLPGEMEHLSSSLSKQKDVIEKLQKSQDESDWKLKVMQRRKDDKDLSLQYLAQESGSDRKRHEKAAILEPGDNFLASPDDYVPEHPLSR